jgi:hypothetical protein
VRVGNATIVGVIHNRAECVESTIRQVEPQTVSFDDTVIVEDYLQISFRRKTTDWQMNINFEAQFCCSFRKLLAKGSIDFPSRGQLVPKNIVRFLADVLVHFGQFHYESEYHNVHVQEPHPGVSISAEEVQKIVFFFHLLVSFEL